MTSTLSDHNVDLEAQRDAPHPLGVSTILYIVCVLMDLEKEVRGSGLHKMVLCSGLSISPPLLVTNDQDVNSGAQKGIVISDKEGATYGLFLTIASRAK